MKQLKRIKQFFALILAMVTALAIAVPAPALAAETAAPAESADTVWLHVVNGSFTGNYDGKEISGEASVEVQLDADRTLPAEVAEIAVSRTHGEFDG